MPFELAPTTCTPFPRTSAAALNLTCTIAGSGINVYMLDTGIRFSHVEFNHLDGTPGSRAVPGFSVFGDNNSTDCFGHGTHTAATVGGEGSIC